MLLTTTLITRNVMVIRFRPSSRLSALVLLAAGTVNAASLATTRQLPLSVATAAALEAVGACSRSGYLVTATVVDSSGLVKAVARGDGAPPHTLDSSRGKAYAAVTLGPNFREDTTSGIVATVG